MMMSTNTTRQQLQAVMTFYVVILSCLLFSGESLSFQPQPLKVGSASISSSRSSSLEMLPGQGNQLAAAYNAASCDKKKEEEEEIGMFQHQPEESIQEQDNVSHWRAVASSKSFLTRVFHKPAVKHPIADVPQQKSQQSPRFQFPFTNFLRNLNQHHHEAEVLKAEASAVYYPIVGFTFVKGCEDALPTISNASIRMPTTSQKKQDVYGWYSTSCKLDLCTEDENVCHNPSIENNNSDDAMI